MYTNLLELFSLFLLLYKTKQAHDIITSVPISFSTKERLITDASSKNMITVNVSNVRKFSATNLQARKFSVAADFRTYATSVYVNSLQISVEMKILFIHERSKTNLIFVWPCIIDILVNDI